MNANFSKRDMWLAAGTVLMVAVGFIAYFAGRTDASNDVGAAASAAAPAMSREEVAVAALPSYKVDALCANWRTYRNTSLESYLRQGFIDQAGGVGYDSGALWTAFRARLERDCVAVY